MIKNQPIFILAGNGSYENQGCEAIVRGTVELLRRYYDNPLFICVSYFRSDKQFHAQCAGEFDNAIIHKKIKTCRNIFDVVYWANRLLRGINPKSNIYEYLYQEMQPYLYDSKAVLSIGGDNYSLDYGIPDSFIGLDNFVLEKRKTLVIWGASVGPFDRIPKYEEYMLSHLQKIPAIFARESATIEYLNKNNIRNNVFAVADPAFLMEPTNPNKRGNKLEIDEGAIGINLSPLMAKYVTNGNNQDWTKIAANVISLISKKTSRTIYLIPHVTNPVSDDYAFLENVLSLVNDKSWKIILIDSIYNAAETKWIISKMFIFAGSRTHSTIAALSSCVPTLSFAYSIKAQGINKDIFGHDFYCMSPNNLKPEIVVEKIEHMLYNHDKIQNDLRIKIQNIKEKALIAGKYLKEMLPLRYFMWVN